MTSPLMTTNQIAEQLRISTRTVERLVANQQIPHIRVGRSVRFDLTEVINEAKEKPNDHPR